MRLLATKFLALSILILAVGCSASTEVSKEKDQELRSGFSRTMSPDEVAKLKGEEGGKAGAPEGAGTPALDAE